MSDFFRIVKCKDCEIELTHFHSIGGYCPTCAIKQIKQLEAEKDVLEKSEICGEIELKAVKAENQRLKEADKCIADIRVIAESCQPIDYSKAIVAIYFRVKDYQES